MQHEEVGVEEGAVADGHLINELFRLIERTNPDTAKQIAARYPDAQLEAGPRAGPDSYSIKLLVEVTEEGLRSAFNGSGKALGILQKRLIWSNTIQVIGTACGVIGSASFLGDIAAAEPRVRWVLGGFTLMGTLCALGAQASERTLVGGLAGETLSKLASSRASARRLLMSLKVARRAGGDEKLIKEIIRESDVIAEELNRMLDTIAWLGKAIS